MRKLHLIPIVHSPEDLGKLAPQVAQRKSNLLSESVAAQACQSVRDFWYELRRALESWCVDFDGWLIYQDALPVNESDHADITDLIVSDLAAKGSQNHQLLRWLVDRGARLQGTESASLLLEEYHHVRDMLESQSQVDCVEQQQISRSILQRRDDFIANRINNTLPPNGYGIVFLGLLHEIESNLAEDIEVLHPFGQPSRTSIHS